MGFLGALLGAAPTVLAGVAKGKRDREETEYTRDQAAMKQMAEENARQQIMAAQQFDRDTASRQRTEDVSYRTIRDTKADRQQALQNTAAADKVKSDKTQTDISNTFNRDELEQRLKIAQIRASTGKSGRYIGNETARRLGTYGTLYNLTTQLIDAAGPNVNASGLLDYPIHQVKTFFDKADPTVQQVHALRTQIETTLREAVGGKTLTPDEAKRMEDMVSNVFKGDKFNREQYQNMQNYIATQYRFHRESLDMGEYEVDRFPKELGSNDPPPPTPPPTPKRRFNPDA